MPGPWYLPVLPVHPCRANSSKAKPETPRTPTSPPFSPSPCLLAPCYLTGDSVRDKCIEMLTAALRMEGERVWGVLEAKLGCFSYGMALIGATLQ